jgi:hypothetical protein
LSKDSGRQKRQDIVFAFFGEMDETPALLAVLTGNLLHHFQTPNDEKLLIFSPYYFPHEFFWRQVYSPLRPEGSLLYPFYWAGFVLMGDVR